MFKVPENLFLLATMKKFFTFTTVLGFWRSTGEKDFLLSPLKLPKLPKVEVRRIHGSLTLISINGVSGYVNVNARMHCFVFRTPYLDLIMATLPKPK